jgi:hypothetical protein
MRSSRSLGDRSRWPRRAPHSRGRSAAHSPQRCTCLTAAERLQGPPRERMSERSDRSTATKAGITDRRLCDRAGNLNDPAVRHFW